MRHRLSVCLGLILLSVVWLAPAAAQEVSVAGQVIERTLPNGLKVLMVRRTEAPLIRCILAYRVGAVNERPGITGISHFHEHMMFKGTRSMGIKPGTLAKDDEYNRKIDALMDQVAAEQAKVKGADEARIADLKKQVSALIDKEKKETIVSMEIFNSYLAVGGTQVNASTGDEMTQYYVTLPKNTLELYLALEADRMVNPVFREFYSERDVITEERRMDENRPGSFFQEQLNATFYGAHPYSNPVVGWMSDISRVTKQEMIEYRDLYYRPDNATLVLAGDLEPDKVMALVTKYFGKIKPRGPSPRVRTEEPSPEYYRRTIGADFKPPYIEKRVIGRAATNPQVTLLFHIPALWHDDVPALYMLGRVLSARTGKLYMDLVQKQEHVSAVMASGQDSMYDGAFTVSATGREVQGALVVPLEQVEKELWLYLEETKSIPVDAQVLDRIKNSVEAQFLQSLAGTGIAGTLARMETAYRWQYLDEQFKRRMAVTPADLMQAARKYLTRDNCVTGILEREQ
jgi:predicted Zn-dependent peptidase